MIYWLNAICFFEIEAHISIKFSWTYCECQHITGKTRGAHTS